MKPNIIWIMADDLSWGDLGCYGQQLIATPNIDRLAEEGMRFTHCYSGSTVCAPARSSLMQGLHTGHASVRDNMIPFEGGYWRSSFTEDDVTVAQVLSDVGYATGLFGKWGLSLPGQPGHPNDKGFDEFFGYLNQRKAHNYYPPYLFHNRDRVELPGNYGHNHLEPNEYDEEGRIIPNGIADPSAVVYSFDLCAAKSLDFVRKHYRQPFFLYLAYTIPHGRHEVPELGQYKDRHWPLIHRIYAAMITRMDHAIGELLALLRQLEIERNTLIFFASDNGYSHSGCTSNPTLDEVFNHRGPWKGEKGSLSQGGVRVPAIAWWPGRIPAGVTSDLIWAFWDFLPTAAEAAGAELPDRCDGISILSALLGGQKPERDYLYWEIRNAQAARIGPWWAVRDHPESPIRIYDADGDPQEEHDLAASMPEIVEKAKAIFAEAHLPTPQSPSPGETLEEWAARRERAGLVIQNNVDW